MPKKTVDTLADIRWVDFRTQLEKAGYTLRCIWHASDEIRIWAVMAGEGKHAPKTSTIVTRHYLEDGGFSFWIEGRTVGVREGAAEVIGDAT